jgi:hypothetical protein
MEIEGLVGKKFLVNVDKDKIYKCHNIVYFTTPGTDEITINRVFKYKDWNSYVYDVTYMYNGREFEATVNEDIINSMTLDN